jgi:uncharacterized membrane protein
MPAEAPPPAEDIPVREVPLLRPVEWVHAGVRDFARNTGPSVMHGLMVVLGGWIISLLALKWWPVLPGAFSGFVLVGPILCTGLYELSRRRERGQPAGFAHVFAAWQRGTRPLVWLGLGLAFAGTAWVLVSALLVAVFVKAPITGAEAFVRYVVFSEGSNLYLVWVMAGGLGASLVFAATVVSAPLLLDRDTDLWTAVWASIRAVGANPVAMGVWATIIMVATAISMATAMLGFIVTIPVIGHATWHAYRDTVDASSLPARE